MTIFERRLSKILQTLVERDMTDEELAAGDAEDKRKHHTATELKGVDYYDIEKTVAQLLKQPDERTQQKLKEFLRGGVENIEELLDVVFKYEIQKECDLGRVKEQLKKFAKDGINANDDMGKLVVEPMHAILTKSFADHAEKRKIRKQSGNEYEDDKNWD